MKNLFENAYFGKVYKTRDGRKAIYCKYEMIYGVVPNSEHSITTHLLLINNMQFVNVFEDGNTVKEKEYPDDIVSEWQEPIDEEELDSLAYCYACEIELLIKAVSRIPTTSDLEEAFKAGYCKAKEI